MLYNLLSEYLINESHISIFIQKTPQEFVILIVNVDDINLIRTPKEVKMQLNI